MRDRFIHHINKNALGRADQRVLLAISGGLDSMVMLHLFVVHGFNVAVAHCNFQLRADESDGDEQFVAKQCKHFQIPFYSKRFETNNYATKKGISTQMAARELRYDWFHELIASEKGELLATAHHRNDAIETILLNVINGRGLDGLTGIAVKKGAIIRPLLFATRNEIEKYAADYSITWREDSSNQWDDYKRNFLRHQVIPKLKQLNPALEESMQRGIKKNLGTLELEKQSILAFEAENIIRQGKRIAIAKSALLSFHHPEAVLYAVIKEFGFSLDHCEQIIPAISGQVGKIFLSRAYQLVIDREELILSPLHERIEEVQLHEGQLHAHSLAGTLQLVWTDDLSLTTPHPYIAILDADKIRFPLTWRAWREGDFIYPLGMENKKKVSDLLVNSKVPLSDKGSVTVLESMGEIIWVAGHRISHRFRITDDSRRALRILMTPHFV